MKWLLVAVINIYRWLPDRIKRQCLFKETCSSLVARVTRESGFWHGFRTLRTRVSQCRPGYLVYFDAEVEGWKVRLADGSVSTNSDLADFVLSPYRNVSVRRWTTYEGLSVKAIGLALSPDRSNDGGTLPRSVDEFEYQREDHEDEIK